MLKVELEAQNKELKSKHIELTEKCNHAELALTTVRESYKRQIKELEYKLNGSLEYSRSTEDQFKARIDSSLQNGKQLTNTLSVITSKVHAMARLPWYKRLLITAEELVDILH